MPSVIARVAAWTLLFAAACTGGSPEIDEEPREFLIREGEEFVVPSFRVAVVTKLWADSPTITEVGLFSDGKELLENLPHRGPDETTILATICGGSRITVHGGLMEDQDARCSGCLVVADKVASGCK
jgi:hypothetical protein